MAGFLALLLQVLRGLVLAPLAIELLHQLLPLLLVHFVEIDWQSRAAPSVLVIVAAIVLTLLLLLLFAVATIARPIFLGLRCLRALRLRSRRRGLCVACVRCRAPLGLLHSDGLRGGLRLLSGVARGLLLRDTVGSGRRWFCGGGRCGVLVQIDLHRVLRPRGPGKGRLRVARDRDEVQLVLVALGHVPRVLLKVMDLLDRPRDVHLLEHLLVDLVLCAEGRAVGDDLLHAVQIRVHISDERVGHEIEQLLEGHDVVHPLAPEERRDISAIHPQQVQCVRVVVLHALRHIDDVQSALAPQNVVLRQIPVHQPAVVIDRPRRFDELHVAIAPVVLVQFHVVEPGRWPSVVPNEVHHQHMLLQRDHAGRRDSCAFQSSEVPALLLSPSAHHFAGIGLAIALPEAELTVDVLVSVLEVQNGGLVHFDGVVLIVGALGMVHVGLLPRAHAAIDGLAEP
mmetsp:Transcript_16397/g.26336  ORF Transcript_16397/g.26336 Transcript_16397/m.26336 type:complete len:454 (-) Transcript_16397:377-1738(-)